MEKSVKADRTADEVQSEFEKISLLSVDLMSVSQQTAAKLHAEYRKSPEFLEHEKDGKVRGINEIGELGRNRTMNDYTVAQIVLMQEGKIPPGNVFHGKEDIIKKSLLLQSDKKHIANLMKGEATLCIHGSRGDLENAEVALQKLGALLGIPVPEKE